VRYVRSAPTAPCFPDGAHAPGISLFSVLPRPCYQGPITAHTAEMIKHRAAKSPHANGLGTAAQCGDSGSSAISHGRQ
jgi:hypothetical protein